MRPWLILLVDVMTVLVLIYFIVLNAFYVLTSVAAVRSLKKYVRRSRSVDIEDLIAETGAPPITLIAPAYNEEATCIEAVRNLMTLNYPEYEVIVCNDGSNDRTLHKMTEAFRLVPSPRSPTSGIETQKIRGIYQSLRYDNLWVVDKENGGKADALNAGLNYCRTPLFCAMDVDCLLERDALIWAVRPFLEDASTVACGGTIRIVNGCSIEAGNVTEVRLPKTIIGKMQVMEYLRAFLGGRMGWDGLNANLIISGAFGVFRRPITVEVGGFDHSTVGEDMELVVRLHRHCAENDIPYRISFIPDPVAWTECPEDIRVLGRQRDRWQRGLTETLRKHSAMFLRRRYGAAGMLAYPYFFFLEMMGPFIEFGGYLMLPIVIYYDLFSPLHAIAFLLVAIVLGTAISVASIGLEELMFRRYNRPRDFITLFLVALLENFGYRQILTAFRFKGMISYLVGSHGWGKMERQGFHDQEEDPLEAL